MLDCILFCLLGQVPSCFLDLHVVVFARESLQLFLILHIVQLFVRLHVVFARASLQLFLRLHIVQLFVRLQVVVLAGRVSAEGEPVAGGEAEDAT